MLYVKPVPDVDILFTIVTVYLSVFFSHSCCLPVSGEIKLYIKLGIKLRLTQNVISFTSSLIATV